MLPRSPARLAVWPGPAGPSARTGAVLPSASWRSHAGIRFATCSPSTEDGAPARTCSQGWAPAVDLCETADAYMVTAELPGPRARADPRRHPGQPLDPARRAAMPASPASSITGSSAATASSSARSCCRRVDADARHRRTERRRPHDRRAQAAGDGPRRVDVGVIAVRRVCLRRLLVLVGLTAGLVVSGRLHDDQRRRRRRAAAASSPAAPAPRLRRWPRRAPISRASLADTVACRHQHLVAAGGAALGVALHQRSVLPVLLRRRRRDVRHARPLRVEPRLGRRHLDRRLRRHQQPRRRRTAMRRNHRRRSADKRELRGQGHRRRPVHRPGPAQDRRQRPAGDSVGRLVEAEGRRMGAGHRQPVPAQSDGHARHRQRARPRQRRHRRLRRLHPDRRRDQPRQLGRRADQRARRADRHQHRDLLARAAATRASASPCRATWPGASSTT